MSAYILSGTNMLNLSSLENDWNNPWFYSQEEDFMDTLAEQHGGNFECNEFGVLPEWIMSFACDWIFSNDDEFSSLHEDELSELDAVKLYAAWASPSKRQQLNIAVKDFINDNIRDEYV